MVIRTLRLLSVLISFCIVQDVQGQILERKNWCLSKGNVSGDEMTNTKAVYGRRSTTPTIRNLTVNSYTFPLRIGVVNSPNAIPINESDIRNTVALLNEGFNVAGIKFVIDKIDQISSPLHLEDLTTNGYTPYNEFSAEHDLDNMISIYLFDYEDIFCNTTPTSISCGRTGGFSYILSSRTSNIVLSKFDLNDAKVIVHDMGHFFGLYHTFEEDQFGKDNFVEDCNIAGDCLCDTPPDPGPAYEIYVNSTTCSMNGLTHPNGNEYDPLIDNYMTYYKPCYLKPYAFTDNQIEILQYAAQSPLRNIFLKN